MSGPKRASDRLARRDLTLAVTISSIAYRRRSLGRTGSPLRIRDLHPVQIVLQRVERVVADVAAFAHVEQRTARGLQPVAIRRDVGSELFGAGRVVVAEGEAHLD